MSSTIYALGPTLMKSTPDLVQPRLFSFISVCMSVTVVFTLVSLIVILAVEGLTPFEELKENPHPAIGLVCIIATIIQPIMAFFRPHPGTRSII
jgi:asparagine N-glycosylation enzyme membrane subunit Stt3